MAKLIFLGTKGEIEEVNEKHRYHASLLLIVDSIRLLIDYGKRRRYTLEELRPDAIFITHAHPDPYAWLDEAIETTVPVYLTQDTYDYGKYHPSNAHIIRPGQEIRIGNIFVTAYRVIHSIRCPTVGFRLIVGEKTLVYNPDLVDIVEKEKILSGVDYYIGDGSSIRANLVRRRGDQLFGHTRITTQINWCRDYHIFNVVFTHLGKETLEKEVELQRLHPDVILAYDGMEKEI